MRINMPKELFDSLGHIDAECLDLYCAGRLGSAEKEVLRRHLAVCEECQDQEHLERSLRQTLLAHQEALLPQPAVAAAPRRWTSWFSPSWGPVAAIAASLLLVGVTSSWTKPARPVDVTLQALRGGVPQAAPAGPHLRLRLDQAGLPGISEPRSAAVDVVDREGRVLLTGASRPEADYAIFESGRSLPAGRYWVRLRHASKLVREYELVVE